MLSELAIENDLIQDKFSFTWAISGSYINKDNNISKWKFEDVSPIDYVFKDKNWVVKYNPVSLLFGGGLFFYQKVISPQIVMGCAFNPSCSNFSKECVHEFGVVKGIFLSADRLTRCTRLSSIDFHPIMFDENKKVNDLPIYYRTKTKK
jgi:putative component of membrane protein insertase Oxa1/YidC/SpoIIIJ protein YidD